MKVNEAVERLKPALKGKYIAEKLEHLYLDEIMARAELRAPGQQLMSVGMVLGVIKEVDDWIYKVIVRLGFDEKSAGIWRDNFHRDAMSAIDKSAQYYNTSKLYRR